jgi:branched-chain amino acid transport system permease protein
MKRIFDGSGATSLIWLLLFLVAGWFVANLFNAATSSVVVLCLYYGVAGASFNFLYSSLGIFSLVQPVFIAVGGFTSVYLYNTYGVSPWLSLLIGPVFAAVLAIPIALAAVRAGTGAILTALITLIVAEAVTPILTSITALGQATGLTLNVKQNPSFWDMQFTSPTSFVHVLLVLNVIVVGFIVWWRRSRFGFYATAIKDAPEAAAAVGIATARLRVWTFVIAAVIGATAGVVYSQYNLLASPGLFFSDTALFEVVVVALVGGIGRSWGSVVGAFAIVYLSNEVTDVANGRAGVGPLAFAVIFLLMAMVIPRGISGTWAQFSDRRRRPRPGAAPAGSPPATAPVESTDIETSRAE